MLRLRVADEVRVFLTVVVLPLREQVVAVSVAQLTKKKIGAVLNRPVAERIHPDADRQPRERIVIFGARQHRSLIAQPPDVAEKSTNQQRTSGDSDRDLCAGKAHPDGSVSK